MIAIGQCRALLAMTAACLFSTGVCATPAGDRGASEEVRIASDTGVTLAGTLTRPASRPVQPMPLPVAITIAGTGPWARGGFASIRARLLARGIATLEYDKRGLGASTGTFVDTLPVMERDIAAAVAFLRTRRDIDPARIALVGLSQGAVAAPVVAAQDRGIAAVGVLSGPIGRRGELFLGILRANLAAAGIAGQNIERVAQAASEWLDARSRAAPAADVARRREKLVQAFVAAAGFTREQAAGAVKPLDTDVVLSMYEADPAKALADIAVPVLVVYGSKDEIIAPALHTVAAAQALAANADAMIVTVPGLDHGLARPASAGTSAATGVNDTMDATTAMLVADWFATRLGTDRIPSEEARP